MAINGVINFNEVLKMNIDNSLINDSCKVNCVLSSLISLSIQRKTNSQIHKLKAKPHLGMRMPINLEIKFSMKNSKFNWFMIIMPILRLV